MKECVPISRRRPNRTEYVEYYDQYVRLVPDGDICVILGEQIGETLETLGSLSPDKADHRYASGKWSLKEVVGHIIDIEWIFSFRALSFARGFTTPLPGIDPKEIAAGGNFDDQSLSDMLKRFQYVRSANIALFETFDETILGRTGMASGYRFSVRSIPYIIAGHERHHLKIIRERYLGADT